MTRWWGRKLDRTGRPKTIVRIFWEHLDEDSVKMVFISHLQRSFNQILEVVVSTESKWAMFQTAIDQAAARSYGGKVADASCGSNPRTRLGTPEVKRAVKLKKEIYRSWLACRTPEAAESYQWAK